MTEPLKPRMSAAGRIEQNLQDRLGRVEGKIDTILNTRLELKDSLIRELNDIRSWTLREVDRLLALNSERAADIVDLETRIRALEQADTVQGTYWQSLGFVRDLGVGVVLAVIGAGVFFK